MVRDVLKSFFRTIGRILAYLLVGAILSYLFAYFKPVKATTIETDEFYLSNLKYAGTILNTFSNFATSGGQNQKFSFGLVPYGYEAGTTLFISIVLCTDFDFGGQGYGDTGLSNFQVYKSDYTCSFNGSSYTGGRIRIVGLNLKTGGGNEFSGGFYLWQMTSGSISLIDFKVSANGFVDIKDYAQQSVIDGQKEQTNEQKKTNDKLDEAENTRKGILGTIKDVLSNIINLPKKIVDLVVDGLKSLFIPDDTEFITNFVDSIEDKLGFIAEVPISVINFGLGLVNASWTEVTSISFPSINIFGYYFWDAQEIDITTGINIFKPYKYITDVLCVVLCVATLNRWREKFTGGGS